MALRLCFALLICSISASTPGYAASLLQDQQALLQIKNSLQLLSSNISSYLSDWSANSNTSSPCTWSRISCTSIQNLTRVTGLDLSSLSVAGALIGGFSNLTELTNLNLSHNLFSGAVSTDIANCTELTSLDLSFNNLSSFETAQGLSLLSNLQLLNLGGNNISSNVSQAIPNNCAHLQTLNLSSNSIMELSSVTWQDCTNLQILDLSHNQLTGFIPTNLTDLPSLNHLILAANKLVGTIPSSLCSSKGPSALVHLDLSDNQLIGTFPLSLSNCSSLQYLDFSGNNMTGNISSQLGNLTALEVLNLSENLFTGSIPSQLGRLTTLHVFMAGSNNLGGTIPSELSNCKNLSLLDLNTNHLEGSFPEFLNEMLSLEYIVLHSNNFSGPIPPSLFNISRLRFLDFSNNSLSGSISPQYANLSYLQFLMLADNRFNGYIPSELGQVTGLQFLDLSSNQLQGSIPSSLGNLQDLLWLTLAYNNLAGYIPVELGNCTSLLWLNLRSNSLTGELPAELATMGQHPKSIFSYNAKNINPPTALGECLMMKRWVPENYPPYSFVYDILDKTRCKSFWIELLTGSPLPLACGQNVRSGAYIQVTDNKLTGPIPASLQGNQTSVLLLSLNYFTSSLPGGLGRLPLRYLNVSHNSLSGPIPDALADNQCFTLLDFSYNNLSGSIPQSLGSLSQLSSFNVSYNPLLSGSIPPVGQFLTFSSFSYVNDSLLCLEIVPGMREMNASSTILPFCNASESSTSNSTQETTSTHSSTKLSSKFLLGLGILSCSAVLLCGGVGFYVVRKWPVHGTSDRDGEFDYIEKKCSEDGSLAGSETHSTVCFFKSGAAASPCANLKELTYADILLATNNFDEENVVGCGGFGIVYKAKLADGSTVAIKKLAHYGQQGEREFVAEMETLGSLEQENLVPLLGCCIFGSEKLIVYKFLCNGSLQDWLHEKQEGAEMLTWPRRLRIACNCAKALSYLHHECSPVLIHRDMKASNILLDEEFNGYLADFGLARELDPGYTHVSTEIAGTLGYVPPEYCQTWRATTKGDVYSFGVVMLELITGRQPICMLNNNNINNNNIINDQQNEGNLVESVRWLLKESRAAEAYHFVVKQTARGQERELLQFIELAKACTLEIPEHRPSMKKVASILESIQEQCMVLVK